MKKIPQILVALLMACHFLAGCSENDCPLTTVSLARFSFLDSRTHAAVSFTQDITVTGIVYTGDTLDIDTVFNKPQNYMSVPLSFTDKTTYVMHYTDVMRDTIEVVHKSTPYVSDIDCVPMMFYEIESIRYTTNALDSITLVNRTVTNEERNNFNIYYRAADAE